MSETAPEPETEAPVLYETRGRVARVTMNRPRYRNAQNAKMTLALDAAFSRAMADDDIGAVILAGVIADELVKRYAIRRRAARELAQ